MKSMVSLLKRIAIVAAVALCGVPALSQAAPMNDYCVAPPFISATITPNLLLLIDNSASMYDLSYIDKGAKQCSTTTSTYCAKDGDCPTGETCTGAVARNPYYCYDETYRSNQNYVGYFETKDASNNDIFYYYRPGTDDFAKLPTGSNFPYTCTSESGNTVVSIASTMCVKYVTASKGFVSFVASGNYLNWLSASKFDVEKQTLTGGKYDGTSLIAESRGCVGQPFVKQALVSDFTNYPSTTSDPNTRLPITFLVRGEPNPYSAGAPSPGGQSYLNLYAGRIYDYGACQQAVDTLGDPTSGNDDVKQDVAACLASSTQGYCQQEASRICFASYPDCDPPLVTAHCSLNATVSCDPSAVPTGCFTSAMVCATGGAPCTDDASCRKAATYHCSNKPSVSCTGTGDDGPCGETMGKCQNQTNWACRTDAHCISGNTNKGPCVGYVSAGTCVLNTAAVDNSPCDTVTQDFGICVPATGGTYVGPCVFTGSVAATKTKVSFQQSMQACWAYRKDQAGLTGGADIGTDEVRTVKNQCSDVYGGYYTCSNNRNQICDPSASDPCGSGNSCTNGPGAIAPGNPALICGSAYEGQMFYEKSSTVWVVRTTLPDPAPGACVSTDTVQSCMEKIHRAFCDAMNTPQVTDPTDAPSNSNTTDNLPAILSGVGVESQLGSSVKKMRVRVATATAPTGKVQHFKDQIRFGVMTFNDYGATNPAEFSVCSNDSARDCAVDTDCAAGGTCTVGWRACSNDFKRACSESAPCASGATCTVVMPPPRVCSNDNTLPCAQNSDCGDSNTCVAATSIDGGYIRDYIKGRCSITTATECYTDNFCPTNETCVSAGVGSYSSGLIKSINDIRAATWTPFAEAFYNAIGYFAKQSVKKCSVSDGACTSDSDCSALTPAGQTCVFKAQKYCANSATVCSSSADCGADPCVYKSRTDLRLNTNDFIPKYNPSNYKCQSNNVLLISDGMSTADRNSSVNSLAGVYTAAGGSSGWTDVCGATGTSPPYAGSVNLDNLAWIAKHRPISSFSKTTATTAEATENSDLINTYVVFNGDSNGLDGECDSKTLLQQTATNGGTQLLQATEPEELQQKINTALEQAAGRSASGTAASILSNSAGSGANILQALFFPLQKYGDDKVKWIGEMLNLWYYVDPFIQKSSVREDTDGNHILDLKSDYILAFSFDNTVGSQNYNKTVVQKIWDEKGDGNEATQTDIGTPAITENITALWRAGAKLHATSAGNRKIYTPCLSGAACLDSDSNLMNFIGTGEQNLAILEPKLQASGGDPYTETSNIIGWVRGSDAPSNYRSRTVDYTYEGTLRRAPWKLGDIITSTPRTQPSLKLNGYDFPAPAGYRDTTYSTFVNKTTGTNPYNRRGMAYVGANDGMLHAFKLGTLDVTPSGTVKARLTGTNLGKEEWAFIPTNALPYLRYLTCRETGGDADFCENRDYSHLYYVDGATIVTDATVGFPGTCTNSTATCRVDDDCPSTNRPCVLCTETNYWSCTKSDASWRTVLIGGMGVGGASRNSTSECTDGEGGTCVKTPILGIGYSSYFALDVTNQTYDDDGNLTGTGRPKFLWEFSDASIYSDTTLTAAQKDAKRMGFATTGVAIVRVKARDASENPDSSKNGRWFAVFGSGPTGPINKSTHQFLAKSDQNLKIYVVDLKASGSWTHGDNYWVIDTLADGATQIPNAFVSSMSGATIDTDRWNISAGGNYQDDALYFGYTQADSEALTASTTWTHGGVLRLVTNQDPSPGSWKLSRVIELNEPVTTGITKLQDRTNRNLWLYFGTGRYFFRADDMAGARHLYGIQEPCYTTANTLDTDCTNDTPSDDNTIDGTATCDPLLPLTDCLTDQTDADQTAAGRGWKIDLDGQLSPSGAERAITDAVAMSNGAVFFSTYKPTSDICIMGGNSFLWAVKYDTGTEPPAAALKGQVLFQLSTGEFKQVKLSDGIFTDRNNRKTGGNWTGKPPSDPPPIISNSNLKPVKRIMHIQEK